MTGPYPWPAGRRRWRIMLAARNYAQGSVWSDNIITELVDARAASLTQALNQPAQFQFTLDGGDPAAALVEELAHEVDVFRWDDYGTYQAGAGAGNNDMPMFRGIITGSQDTLTEDANTVVFTAQDNLAPLGRRLITAPFSVTNLEQDTLVADLVNLATINAKDTTGATSFMPGSWLPLAVEQSNPGQIGTAGLSPRPPSGQLRTRAYLGSEVILTCLTDLAAVINGFDLDVIPHAWRIASGGDIVRIFYPAQGVTKTSPILEYGVSVSGLTRSMTSADYANFIRVLGNNGTATPAAAQLYSERWSSEANNVTVVPVGLWQLPDSGAGDVSVQATLDQKAQGDLALNQLIPTYTLTLRPDWWQALAIQMGDVVPLRINSGRLYVDTTVRVVGITYAIGDDGQEDVTLTVGAPPTTFTQIVRQGQQGIAALARR